MATTRIEDQHIAVWFSCGAASAVAAKLTLEKYGQNNRVSIINNPIKEEDEDNQRFLKDVESWLGHEITFAVNPKFPSQSCVDVWEKERYMAGPAGASCTRALKKVARQVWENEHKPDWTILGFTSEEQKRADRFRLTERETLLTPLVDEGLTKQDCFDILHKEGIQLPRVYYRGLPNANCLGCVKVSSPTFWNWLRVEYPEVFKERQKQSREIGARLVTIKGKRAFLDELDPNLEGRPMKSYDFECGIFCEENPEDE